MKELLTGAAIMALCPAAAMAVGLDRSGQPVDILFEDGNYFELSFGRVFPSIQGEDRALAGYEGAESGDVGEDFNQLGAGVKFQVSEKLSFALIADEPYGVEVNYPGEGGSFAPTGVANPPVYPIPAEDRSNNLGGTYADVDSSALTAMARYEFNDYFSIHGGLRYQRLEARVGLSGFAYGPTLSGYTADFDRDYAFGYAVGAAYERPDIALRVAITYFSEIDHELDTTETRPAFAPTGPGIQTSVTEITTPQAINLDFQTGLNQRTLLFGQLRYAWYGDVTVDPPYFDRQSDRDIEGTSLTELDDGYSLAVGVGRALTDRLSGSVTLGYEHAGDDDGLVSPLAPTNGQKSIGLGLSYDVNESFTVAGGVRYVWLGDASAETGTPDEARADFSDSHVVGVGMQIGYHF